MQSIFSNALSRLLSQHLPLSASRRETLSWLVLLMMRQGTVCLWRLAAHVESHATLASVQRRFYRFFQHVHLDGAITARIVVELLGLEGKAWSLTIDRTGSVRNLVRGAGFILGLEPVSKDDSELSPRFEPFSRRRFPSVACVVENQIQQL